MIDLEQLKKQFQGRHFGELVLHHLKKQTFEQIVVGLQSTIQLLPPKFQPEVMGFIDGANTLAHEQGFWQMDCGKALDFITGMAREELMKAGIVPTDEDCFNLFNIVVLNFAYSASNQPKMQEFIESSFEKSFLRRIFGG